MTHHTKCVKLTLPMFPGVTVECILSLKLKSLHMFHFSVAPPRASLEEHTSQYVSNNQLLHFLQPQVVKRSFEHDAKMTFGVFL